MLFQINFLRVVKIDKRNRLSLDSGDKIVARGCDPVTSRDIAWLLFIWYRDVALVEGAIPRENTINFILGDHIVKLRFKPGLTIIVCFFITL